MEKSVKVALIIVAAVILVALIGAYTILQVSPVSSNTVHVTGMAQVKALPNLVSVYFNVETNGTTSKEANDKNSEIVNAVTANLIKEGFAQKDITTQNFNIYPDNEWTPNGTVNKGYKAVHSLKVQISTDNVEKIGSAIDAGVNGGASVSYINFELSQDKQNEYKSQALRQATEDARIKADSIASGLGKKLGAIVSVSDSSFDYNPWPLYNAMDSRASGAEAKAAVTSIQPGEQTINAQISVTYKI